MPLQPSRLRTAKLTAALEFLQSESMCGAGYWALPLQWLMSAAFANEFTAGELPPSRTRTHALQACSDDLQQRVLERHA